MEYSINQLAKMAGVSTRTLRYYDEIDLLKPIRTSSSGYRIYNSDSVDRLQLILFYRELGFKLDYIKAIIDSDEFDVLEALKRHQQELLHRRKEIDLLIQNVKKTIESKERGIVMSDHDKFIGFKKKLIEENEQKYGKEARQKYGDEAVDYSNKVFKDVSETDYQAFVELSQRVIDTFVEAYRSGNPKGEIAMEAAKLHHEWLMVTWKSYNKEAHRNLSQMYVDDERFRAYYNQHQEGLSAFIRDAIHHYTNQMED